MLEVGGFIIQVNGNIVIESGKHYVVTYACNLSNDKLYKQGYSECKYNNRGKVEDGFYYHYVDGDLVLNEECKSVPYAIYVATGDIIMSEECSLYMMGEGYRGAYAFLMDEITSVEDKIGDDLFINRAVFIEIFSLLELFLSDMVLACIYSNMYAYKKALIFFAENNGAKKVDKESIVKKVHYYFFKSIVYHRFEDVKSIFKQIVNVELPSFDNLSIHKRHNIIHRGSLSGVDRMRMTVISEGYLKVFVSSVKNFAKELLLRYESRFI